MQQSQNKASFALEEELQWQQQLKSWEEKPRWLGKELIDFDRGLTRIRDAATDSTSKKDMLSYALSLFHPVVRAVMKLHRHNWFPVDESGVSVFKVLPAVIKLNNSVEYKELITRIDELRKIETSCIAGDAFDISIPVDIDGALLPANRLFTCGLSFFITKCCQEKLNFAYSKVRKFFVDSQIKFSLMDLEEREQALKRKQQDLAEETLEEMGILRRLALIQLCRQLVDKIANEEEDSLLYNQRAASRIAFLVQSFTNILTRQVEVYAHNRDQLRETGHEANLFNGLEAIETIENQLLLNDAPLTADIKAIDIDQYQTGLSMLSHCVDISVEAFAAKPDSKEMQHINCLLARPNGKEKATKSLPAENKSEWQLQDITVDFIVELIDQFNWLLGGEVIAVVFKQLVRNKKLYISRYKQVQDKLQPAYLDKLLKLDQAKQGIQQKMLELQALIRPSSERKMDESQEIETRQNISKQQQIVVEIKALEVAWDNLSHQLSGEEKLPQVATVSARRAFIDRLSTQIEDVITQAKECEISLSGVGYWVDKLTELSLPRLEGFEEKFTFYKQQLMKWQSQCGLEAKTVSVSNSYYALLESYDALLQFAREQPVNQDLLNVFPKLEKRQAFLELADRKEALSVLEDQLNLGMLTGLMRNNKSINVLKTALADRTGEFFFSSLKAHKDYFSKWSVLVRKRKIALQKALGSLQQSQEKWIKYKQDHRGVEERIRQHFKARCRHVQTLLLKLGSTEIVLSGEDGFEQKITRAFHKVCLLKQEAQREMDDLARYSIEVEQVEFLRKILAERIAAQVAAFAIRVQDHYCVLLDQGGAVNLFNDHASNLLGALKELMPEAAENNSFDSALRAIKQQVRRKQHEIRVQQTKKLAAQRWQEKLQEEKIVVKRRFRIQLVGSMLLAGVAVLKLSLNHFFDSFIFGAFGSVEIIGVVGVVAIAVLAGLLLVAALQFLFPPPKSKWGALGVESHDSTVISQELNHTRQAISVNKLMEKRTALPRAFEAVG